MLVLTNLYVSLSFYTRNQFFFRRLSLIEVLPDLQSQSSTSGTSWIRSQIVYHLRVVYGRRIEAHSFHY